MSVPRPRHRPGTVCKDCGGQVALGRSVWRCHRCLDRRNARRNARADRNLCRRCSAPTSRDRRLCDSCREREYRARRERAAEHYARGLCSRCCGRERDREPRKLCTRCAEDQAQRQKEIRLRRQEAGLCPRCGGERDRKDRALCTECGEKAAAYARAERAARARAAPPPDRDPDWGLTPAQWELLEAVGGDRARFERRRRKT